MTASLEAPRPTLAPAVWHPSWCVGTELCELAPTPSDRDHSSTQTAFAPSIDDTFSAAASWWAIGDPADDAPVETGVELEVESLTEQFHHARLNMSADRARTLGRWLIEQADALDAWETQEPPTIGRQTDE